CYLTVALHLFLLEQRATTVRGHAIRLPVGRAAAYVGAAAWVFVSLTGAFFKFFHFGEAGPRAQALVPVQEASQIFRVVNSYHLFAAVTRERIEPEIQIQQDAAAGWTAYHLAYKPGDPADAPRFVAPHQPRVDFLLWFYGLASQRRQPTYVAELLARLCEDPAAVAPLFQSPPPPSPTAVRIVFWQYRFTSAAEKRSGSGWWNRRELGATPPLKCQLDQNGAQDPLAPPRQSVTAG
ncbi:MAG: lipase maturation factor family protein, partial [Deltaproteobacteria bacterium]|nr:lipase maturation factor family protein [Deltaproteobacteria bacterium]